tara:strand:+ start:120 stop:887 length:768 start_codon:yes stop_codon:yes gene_type:complete
MSSQDEWEQPYTARIPFPDYLERGRTQLVRLEVYRDGALVSPTSGTFSLYDASHVAQIDAAAVTIASSRAQYSINAASLPASLPVGEGWQEEWALTFSDGVTRTFRRSAALVLRAVHPVITDADLLACYSDLDDLRPSDMSSYQGPIDEAWRQIIGRLVGRGRFPYLILDPWSLREIHLETTLSLIFRDFASSIGEGRYLDLAESHKKTAASAWRSLSFDYDTDHDGKSDGKGKRTSYEPVIYLSNAPRGRWGGR